MRYFNNEDYADIWEQANRDYYRRNIPLTTENIMRFARLLEVKVVNKSLAEQLRVLKENI